MSNDDDRQVGTRFDGAASAWRAGGEGSNNAPRQPVGPSLAPHFIVACQSPSIARRLPVDWIAIEARIHPLFSPHSIRAERHRLGVRGV